MRESEIQETVYCLKYALTKGIVLAPGRKAGDGHFMWHNDGWPICLKVKEWTRDGDKAVQIARDIQTRKIVALKAQIEKVSKKVFTLPKEAEDV